MRAKDIAAEFIESVPNTEEEEQMQKALLSLMNTFIEDFKNLQVARNIQLDRALIPLCKEMDQKWNSVRSKLYKSYGIHVIIPYGFREILKDQVPQVYRYYMQNLNN